MKRYKFIIKPKDESHAGHVQYSDDPSYEPKIVDIYIKAGWYEEKELLKLGLDKADALETREIEIKPEELKPLPTFKDLKLDNGDIITAEQLLADFAENNEIRGDEYVIPAETKTEYRFDANYIIEIIDRQAEIDQAEADRLQKEADRQYLKDNVGNIVDKAVQEKLIEYAIKHLI